MKIRMIKTVLPDPLYVAKPGTILRAGEEYEAKANRKGAISGLCSNGKYLGVYPGEFSFVTVPAWVREIWVGKDPQALVGAEDEEKKSENTMIYAKTAMKTMPETCMECKVGRQYTGAVHCPLLDQCIDMHSSKRSDDCPLEEMQTEAAPASKDAKPLEPVHTGYPSVRFDPKPLTRQELEQMDGEPVWVVRKEPYVWAGWMLINLDDGVAISNSYCVCISDYSVEWLAHRLIPSPNPTQTLSRRSLRMMNRKPVFITCNPDSSGERCKLWALVFIENGKIRLQNSLGGCSTYEEVEGKIESIMTM